MKAAQETNGIDDLILSTPVECEEALEMFNAGTTVMISGSEEPLIDLVTVSKDGRGIRVVPATGKNPLCIKKRFKVSAKAANAIRSRIVERLDDAADALVSKAKKQGSRAHALRIKKTGGFSLDYSAPTDRPTDTTEIDQANARAERAEAELDIMKRTVLGAITQEQAKEELAALDA